MDEDEGQQRGEEEEKKAKETKHNKGVEATMDLRNIAGLLTARHRNEVERRAWRRRGQNINKNIS